MLKFVCIFLLLLQCVFSLKLQFEKHETENLKLFREGRLPKSIRQQNLKRHFGLKTSKSGLADFQDFFYTVNVTIGTPPKQFRLIVDTGDALTWIPDVKIDDKHHSGDIKICEMKSCYNGNESSTYIKDGREFGPSFSAGSIAGYLGIDTFRIGDNDQLIMENATFGQVTLMAQLFDDSRFDGIFGLAFQSIADDSAEPIFQTMVKEKLVDQPIFTIWIQTKGEESENQVGGQLTLGDIDSEHCSSDVTYVPLSEETWFKFKIDGYQLNNNKVVSKKLSAISDLGTSLIVMPYDVVQQISNTLNATYDFNYGLYSIDCKTKFNLSFIIGDKILTIDEKVGIFDIPESNSCYLAFEAGDDEISNIILGDVFAREWCQIFDTTGKIGFTKSLKP